MFSNIDEAFSTRGSDVWGDNLECIEVDSVEGKCINNYVLVEVEGFTYEYLKINSTKTSLKVDNEFEPYKYIVRTGIVKNVPKMLEFWYDNLENGMVWETEMQLEVGDRVWFSAFAAMSGEKLISSGKKYIIMHYSDLYLSKRGERIIPLNGNVLLEQQYKTVEALSYSKTIVDTNFAKVSYIGLKNTSYQNENKEDCKELEVGMEVCITGIPMRKLELEPYLVFDDKEYLICQNCEIQGYLK